MAEAARNQTRQRLSLHRRRGAAKVAPFLAAISATYWLLLREYDINYYLKARPPVFIAACAIVAVLALSLTIILARKLSGWVLVLPQVVFERMRPLRAFAESAQRMSGRRVHAVEVFALWGIIALVTEFATSIKAAEDGDFQLYLFGWSGRADPDGNSFITQTCKGPFNYDGYCDPTVDALHQEARRINDPAARKAVYEKIAARVLPGAAGGFLYLYHPQVLIALSDRVDGFTQMPDGLVRVMGLKLK